MREGPADREQHGLSIWQGGIPSMFCRRTAELASNFVGFSGKVGRERKVHRCYGGPVVVGVARWECEGHRESLWQREREAWSRDSGQCLKVSQAGDFPIEATKHPAP